jgi:hypothetical protein
MDLQRSGRRAFLRACWMAGTAIAALAEGSGSALAQETASYSYDALGRLVSSNTSGGPNNGVATGMCFDAAGNRTQYVVATTGAPCTTPPNAMLMQTSASTQANSVEPEVSPSPSPKR